MGNANCRNVDAATHLNLIWHSWKLYRLNYHSLFSFLKYHFPQSFHCPGCFAVPDSSLLILTIRDIGVRLYVVLDLGVSCYALRES